MEDGGLERPRVLVKVLDARARLHEAVELAVEQVEVVSLLLNLRVAPAALGLVPGHEGILLDELGVGGLELRR